MPKMKMSELCKMSMAEQFGFKNSELVQIENFMNNQNQKTAKEILDNLLQDKKLTNKQKIVVAYVVGNSARETAVQEELQKGIRIDMSGGVPPIGG
jgi:hypothetical protein